MKSFGITCLLFLLTISLFDSCKKDHLIGTYLLSDEMKSQNPYQVNDTIKFVSDSGQTNSWCVKGRGDSIDTTLAGINTADYYILEIETTSITMLDSKGLNYIHFQMGGQLSNKPIYKLALYLKDGNGSTFEFSLPLSKQTTNNIDSLLVIDQWIKDVFISENEKSGDKAYKLYYTVKHGIVRIDFSNGSYWENMIEE